MQSEPLKHKELTGAIIGAAMEVHKVLGIGFQEKIYQRSLSREMTLRGIPHYREATIIVPFKGIVAGTRRIDFFVGELIGVEIKAIANLEDVHLVQTLNYLEAGNIEVGLLINFGAMSLQYKRLLNKKYDPTLPSRISPEGDFDFTDLWELPE